jgi:hypothetical protein
MTSDMVQSLWDKQNSRLPDRDSNVCSGDRNTASLLEPGRLHSHALACGLVHCAVLTPRVPTEHRQRPYKQLTTQSVVKLKKQWPTPWRPGAALRHRSSPRNGNSSPSAVQQDRSQHGPRDAASSSGSLLMTVHRGTATVAALSQPQTQTVIVSYHTQQVTLNITRGAW